MLLHLVLFILFILLIIDPGAFAAAQHAGDQSGDLVPSNESARQKLSPWAGIAIALGTLGILLDIFHFAGINTVFWLLLELTVLLMGLASFVQSIQRVIDRPFRSMSKVLAASVGFLFDAVSMLFRTNKMRRSRTQLCSTCHEVHTSFKSASVTQNAPSRCDLTGACAVCGASDTLTAISKPVCVRSMSPVVPNVVASTFLGVVLDHLAYKLTGIDQLHASMPTFWFTAIFFIGSVIVVYVTATKRYFTVAYSLCDQHSASRHPFPRLVVVDDSVYAEYGSTAAKAEILFHRLVDAGLIGSKDDSTGIHDKDTAGNMRICPECRRPSVALGRDGHKCSSCGDSGDLIALTGLVCRYDFIAGLPISSDSLLAEVANRDTKRRSREARRTQSALANFLASPDPEPVWYCFINKNEVGPANKEEMMRMALAATLTFKTLVTTDGHLWEPAEKLSEVKAFVDEAVAVRKRERQRLTKAKARSPVCAHCGANKKYAPVEGNTIVYSSPQTAKPYILECQSCHRRTCIDCLENNGMRCRACKVAAMGLPSK